MAEVEALVQQQEELGKAKVTMTDLSERVRHAVATANECKEVAEFSFSLRPFRWISIDFKCFQLISRSFHVFSCLFTVLELTQTTASLEKQLKTSQEPHERALEFPNAGHTAPGGQS